MIKIVRIFKCYLSTMRYVTSNKCCVGHVCISVSVCTLTTAPQCLVLQGGLILNSIINHSSAAKVMEWQPNGRILAIGWADGNIFLIVTIFNTVLFEMYSNVCIVF